MVVFQGIVSRFQSLVDRTLRVQIDTQEATLGTKAKIIELHNVPVLIVLKEGDLTQESLDAIQEMPVNTPEGKSLSKKQRDAFFGWFSRNDKGFNTFDQFYEHHMNLSIDNINNKDRDGLN